MCICLLAACPLEAQKESPDSEESCLHFAQDFYSWYVKNAVKKEMTRNGQAAWKTAIQLTGNLFSAELTRALMKSEEEEKAEGDAVLDFDPILASQDPADRYNVRSVARKDGHYLAKVYGVWQRPVPDQGMEPQVVAEIAFEKDRWVFVNFHYPNCTSRDNENLLSILRYQYRPE